MRRFSFDGRHRSLRSIFRGGFVLLGTALLVPGCQETPLEGPAVNEPPETIITGETPKPGETSYRVRVRWQGFDPDGRVIGFQYAWDDTAGSGEEPAWRWAAATDTIFTIEADPAPDGLDPSQPYFGYPTLWARAVDVDGAVDPTPAHSTFNAVTVAPTTMITESPAPCFCFFGERAGPYVRITWEAEDPDGEVIGFWIKWDTTTSDHPTAEGSDPSQHGWVFLPGEQHAIFTYREPVEPMNSFAIFAVDDAGAIEQTPSCPRNYACWISDPELRGPGLCVDGGPLGVRSSPRSGFSCWCDPETGETEGSPAIEYTFSHVSYLFHGTAVRFRWGRLTDPPTPQPLGYQFALDDTTVWSPVDPFVRSWPPSDSVWVPDLGEHTFYLRSVDVLGPLKTEGFRFHVLRHPGTNPRRILLVRDEAPWGHTYSEWDDWPFRDTEAFYDSVLWGFAYDIHDARILRAPQLPMAAQYSTIIWSVGDDSRLHTELLVGREILTDYVHGGGNLLIVGMSPLSAMLIRTEYGFEPADICGTRFQPDLWMAFDPALCGSTQPGEHPLFTLFGVREMKLPIAPIDGVYAHGERDRMVRGGRPVDRLRWRVLRVDPEKAGGFSLPGVDWLPAASVSAEGRLESWVEPLYWLNSADSTVAAAEYLIGFLAEGEHNPRRPNLGRWGDVAFLGLHPFFLEQEDARSFFRKLLEREFGEPYRP